MSDMRLRVVLRWCSNFYQICAYWNVAFIKIPFAVYLWRDHPNGICFLCLESDQSKNSTPINIWPAACGSLLMTAVDIVTLLRCGRCFSILSDSYAIWYFSHCTNHTINYTLCYMLCGTYTRGQMNSAWTFKFTSGLVLFLIMERIDAMNCPPILKGFDLSCLP